MGELKPLADLGGRTLLARAVGVVRLDRRRRRRGGHRPPRGRGGGAAAEALGARPVHNPRFDDGMYTSVQAGAAAVGGGAALLPAPGRLPAGAAGDRRPAGAGRRGGRRGGRAAGVGGIPGHPPLLAPDLREEILASEPAGGLRELLTRPAGAGAPRRRGRPRRAVRRRHAGELEQLRRLAAIGGPAVRTALPRAAARAVSSRSASRTARRWQRWRPRWRRPSTSVEYASASRSSWPPPCCTTSPAASPGTATRARDLLERLGYPRVARVVRRHMDLGDALWRRRRRDAGRVSSPTSWCRTTAIVGVEARFAVRFARWAGDPVAPRARCKASGGGAPATVRQLSRARRASRPPLRPASRRL